MTTSMGKHYHGLSTSAAMPATGRGSSTHTATPTTTTRPKIKIIHIIAPEIIKTDVANFRDLVQRLTGKPVVPCSASAAVGMATTSSPPVQKEEEEKKKETTKKRPAPDAMTTTAAAEEWSDYFAAQQDPCSKKRKIKCEVKVEEEGGFSGDYYDLADRSGADLWMDLNPEGFLSFLEEADVFQGLAAAADDFLLPLGSSMLDLVGEMYAS